MAVVGPRFHAYLPLGSRMALEFDLQFLLEAYQQGYMDVMAMPSSRRHRIVKTREEIVRRRNAAASDGSVATTPHRPARRSTQGPTRRQ